MLGLKGGLCIKASFESRQRRCNGSNKTPIASRKERNIQQVDDFIQGPYDTTSNLLYRDKVAGLVFSRPCVHRE